jgi:hypothetical protein
MLLLLFAFSVLLRRSPPEKRAAGRFAQLGALDGEVTCFAACDDWEASGERATCGPGRSHIFLAVFGLRRVSFYCRSTLAFKNAKNPKIEPHRAPLVLMNYK